MATHRREFLRHTALTLGAAALPLGCARRGGGVPGEVSERKRLLILGGTGFLGPQLVEAALARGHTVTLFNRGKTRVELFPQLEKLRGDRDGKLDALVGRQWDAVVDTSGYVPRIVKQSADLLAPNVGQYVFISTISVYGSSRTAGMDETAPVATAPDPTTEDVKAHYGALKALCEQAAEAAMPGRVSNVRPGLIVGPGDPTDRFTYWPVRVAQGGEVLAPGDGKDPVQFIDARDLAEWTILAIERKHVGVYNAVGPAAPLPMSALLGACKTVSGSDAQLTWVSAGFLEKQEVSPWSDMPVWVPSSGESMGFGRLSNARILQAGAKFRPVEDTVRATLDWWKSQPEERRAKLRAGLQREREAQVLTAWKAAS